MKVSEKSLLEAKLKSFRSHWNTAEHDWIFVESQYFIKGVLIVAFTREYSLGVDQSTYSMVYIFTKKKELRIYYDKFTQGTPEWTDRSKYMASIISASFNKNTLHITCTTGKGGVRTFSHTFTK